MPNVTPTANDVVQIKIRGTGSSNQEQFITAEIVDLQETTYWKIKVPGEPELTGVIDIDKYQWDHKQSRWTPKEAPVQITSSAAKRGVSTLTNDELEIPRPRVPPGIPLTPGVKNWSDADA